MEKFTFLITILIAILSAMSIIVPFIIEAIKKIVPEETIIKVFKMKEIFCFLVTIIFAIIIYILAWIFVPEIFLCLNPAQFIAALIVFAFVSGICALSSYDTIIKYLLELIKKFF